MLSASGTIGRSSCRRIVRGKPVRIIEIVFKLPLNGEVGDIRSYTLPERIGVMTMRSLTPHREEDGGAWTAACEQLGWTAPGDEVVGQCVIRCSRNSFSKKSLIRDSAASLTSSFAPNL